MGFGLVWLFDMVWFHYEPRHRYISLIFYIGM